MPRRIFTDKLLQPKIPVKNGYSEELHKRLQETTQQVFDEFRDTDTERTYQDLFWHLSEYARTHISIHEQFQQIVLFSEYHKCYETTTSLEIMGGITETNDVYDAGLFICSVHLDCCEPVFLRSEKRIVYTTEFVEFLNIHKGWYKHVIDALEQLPK